MLQFHKLTRTSSCVYKGNNNGRNKIDFFYEEKKLRKNISFSLLHQSQQSSFNLKLDKLILPSPSINHQKVKSKKVNLLSPVKLKIVKSKVKSTSSSRITNISQIETKNTVNNITTQKMRLSNTSFPSMDKIIYDNQTNEGDIENEEEVHFRFVELYQKKKQFELAFMEKMGKLRKEDKEYYLL